MKFRLIVMREKDAFSQMAVDEAILNSVIENESPETIRYFDFSPPAITIGRLQKIESINLKLCEKNGIDVVRRLTGGRAVVHNGDFTFSLIIKKNNSIFGGSVYETYRAISMLFLSSLRLLNVPVSWKRVNHPKMKSRNSFFQKNPLCFSSISRYELTIDRRKVLGVSQYRKKDTILIQGSLLLKKTHDSICNLFTTQVTPNAISNVEESGNMTITFETFGRILRKEIERKYVISIKEGTLTFEEKKRAKEAEKRYRSNKWNYFRSCLA
ncbi:lipoate--protein ligase family protein [candidate division WOR-3 bacterium]|nr:lipoate--protein ligase family protein [candidate division WOR-3 bacterium]